METAGIYFTAAMSAILALAGCQEVVNSDTSIVYSNDHFNFAYPDNWEILKEGGQDGFRFVVLQGPASTTLTVQSFPATVDLPINEFAKRTDTLFTKELPVGEVTFGENTPATVDVDSNSYDGIESNLSVTLMGQDHPYVQRYFTLLTDERRAYFRYYAATKNDNRLSGVTGLALSTFSSVQVTHSPRE